MPKMGHQIRCLSHIRLGTLLRPRIFMSWQPTGALVITENLILILCTYVFQSGWTICNSYFSDRGMGSINAFSSSPSLDAMFLASIICTHPMSLGKLRHDEEHANMYC